MIREREQRLCVRRRSIIKCNVKTITIAAIFVAYWIAGLFWSTKLNIAKMVLCGWTKIFLLYKLVKDRAYWNPVHVEKKNV